MPDYRWHLEPETKPIVERLRWEYWQVPLIHRPARDVASLTFWAHWNLSNEEERRLLEAGVWPPPNSAHFWSWWEMLRPPPAPAPEPPPGWPNHRDPGTPDGGEFLI